MHHITSHKACSSMLPKFSLAFLPHLLLPKKGPTPQERERERERASEKHIPAPWLLRHGGTGAQLRGANRSQLHIPGEEGSPSRKTCANLDCCSFAQGCQTICSTSGEKKASAYVGELYPTENGTQLWWLRLAFPCPFGCRYRPRGNLTPRLDMLPPGPSWKYCFAQHGVSLKENPHKGVRKGPLPQKTTMGGGDEFAIDAFPTSLMLFHQFHLAP